MSDFDVSVGGSAVFLLRGPPGGAAEARAREATRALKRALEVETTNEVDVARSFGRATLSVGRTAIVELSEEDARLAGASSLDAHVTTIRAALTESLRAERQRSAIAGSVFSVSLVVFLGLIALYLVRKVGEFAERGQRWLAGQADSALSLRVRRIEVLHPAAVRGMGVLTFGLGKWVAQIGVAYAWLVVVLSLFESTRGYTQRLTGYVLAPVSALVERLAVSLPLFAVVLISAFALLLLLRFVRLFFDTVSRGEATLAWLPAGLVAPTSFLLRAAIVLLALVFAAPVVTGSSEGSLGRIGMVALLAIGLAATPLLASVLAGAVVLFGKRLEVGQHVELRGQVGRIVRLDLLEMRVETLQGTELRLPHLVGLLEPTHALGVEPRVTFEVVLATHESAMERLHVLESAAVRAGRAPLAELVSVGPEGARYRISVTGRSLRARSELQAAVLALLDERGIELAEQRTPSAGESV